MRAVVSLLIALLLASSLSATPGRAQRPGVQGRRAEIDIASTISCEMDLNADSRSDRVIWLDSEGDSVYEEMDYNQDGRMDDFYYFREGILFLQEIDSNYDDSIDVWIYLFEGIYIQRIERDTNFDGRVDVVHNYNE